MSTNAEIIFKHEKRKIRTYKHWDGYPDVTKPLIMDFLAWYPESRRKQEGYAVASWFYYVKKRYSDVDDIGEPLGMNDNAALSYGVVADGVDNAWIEHTYLIDLKNDRVEHYRHNPDNLEEREPKNVWTVASQ